MSGFQEEVTEAPNYYDHIQTNERNDHEDIPIDDGYFDVSTQIFHRRFEGEIQYLKCGGRGCGQ